MSKDPIEKALAEPWLIAPSAVSEIDNWGEPTDATKQKDALIRELMDGRHRDLDKMREMKAEIEHLKLEMDGVDNAKEEIGRLLGLTEEFRWKRISAAIHEQKRLIRELVAALAAVGDQNTYDARRVLAKAKAMGFEP